jgi:hypothetical protein
LFSVCGVMAGVVMWWVLLYYVCVMCGRCGVNIGHYVCVVCGRCGVNIQHYVCVMCGRCGVDIQHYMHNRKTCSLDINLDNPLTGLQSLS